MPLLVVRHATAGKRERWAGDDRERSVDAQGRLQADRLAETLERFRVTRVASSGYVRCVQTVEPLARARGLAVETAADLEEGAEQDRVVAFLDGLGNGAVACTHGDVLEALFGSKGKKGSTRVVELADGRLRVLETLPPPA